MEYRANNGPGCGGGCLLLLILLFLLGGSDAVIGVFKYGVPLALILIFVAPWAFTAYVRKKVAAYEQAQTENHRRFVVLLIKVLVKIAESDGHFTKAELRTILNFFQYNLRYSPDQMYWVKQIVKESRNLPVSLNALLEEFRASFNYESRLILLELIFQLVYTKQPPEESKLRLARDLARILEISVYDLRAIEAKYRYGWRQDSGGQRGYQRQQESSGWTAQPDREEQYYAVLGLEKGATFEEIKKSYRKLCLQYHPDKVAHLGEEFKRVAEEKMKDINVAYDYFEKKFK